MCIVDMVKSLHKTRRQEWTPLFTVIIITDQRLRKYELDRNLACLSNEYRHIFDGTFDLDFLPS